MALETRPPTTRLFTVDEYRWMGRVGIIQPDERVELIDGEIVQMSPIGDPHAGRTNRAAYRLNRALGDDVIVAVQNPIRLGRDSEPQPDVAVLRYRADFYESRPPTEADALLIVEVADSSLKHDLERKARLYARFGIPEYWVEDLNADALVVHRDPTPDGYATVRTLRRGDRVRPVAVPDRELAVEELLG